MRAKEKGRWIPVTFAIWAWLLVFLVSPDFAAHFFPRLGALAPTTWSGELLRNSLGFLLVAWLLPIYLERDGLRVRDLGFARRPLRLDLVQGFAAGASIYGLSVVLFLFLIRGPKINLALDLYPSADAQGVAKVLYFVMLAPVMEELVFRAGLIVPLRKCWGSGTRRDAVYALLSGIAFACPHYLGDPLYYGGYVLLGAAFAVLYQRTGSLRTCMIAHAFMNASALTLGAILR